MQRLAFRAWLAATLLLVTAAIQAAEKSSTETAIATFAGGCFWCVEADFDHVPGVLRTTSGYTGGVTKNPTYDDVTYGDTGHYEAVEIEFDPSKVGYEQLLDVFWRSVDPTDAGGQFCDRGKSYRTAVFTHSAEQAEQARASKARAEAALERPVVTPLVEAGPFYHAEEYHQDYYTKNPVRYHYYRFGCRRDKRIKALWGEEAHKGIDK